MSSTRPPIFPCLNSTAFAKHYFSARLRTSNFGASRLPAVDWPRSLPRWVLADQSAPVALSEKERFSSGLLTAHVCADPVSKVGIVLPTLSC